MLATFKLPQEADSTLVVAAKIGVVFRSVQSI
jgi:hypothetical protein